MVFRWSLSDSKSPQVSRALLSILAVLNNVVVWMVSTRPLNSKSSSPFDNPSVTVPRAPIIIGITVTFMSHSFFFQFPRKIQVLFLLFIFFQLYSLVSKVHNFVSFCFLFCFFLLLIVISSGHRAEIRWSACMSKSHSNLCLILHIRCWVVHIPFLRMVKFKLLAQLPVDYFPHFTQSCLVLYSFCANLLHSLIMWLMVSSLSPHNLHLLFCYV